MPPPIRILTSLLVILLVVAPLVAQDEAVPTEPGPSAPGAERNPAGLPGPGLPGHREVYIPFEDLKDVFEKEGQGVFVPYAEFLRLWEANLDRRPTPAEPPVPYLISRAFYAGRVDGDLAVVTAEIDIETFTEGWSAVPIGLAGIAIAEATIDGEPATLEPIDQGYRAILPEKGAYRLALRFVTAIAKSEDRRSLGFKVPSTPVSRLTFDVPEEGARVEVTPNLATTRTDAEPGVTRVMAYVGAAGEIRLSWKPRPVEVQVGPALVFADSLVSASVEETALRVLATIDYRIHRAPVSTLRLEIPEGAKVLFVEGEVLRSWDLEDGVLTVRLHRPLEEKYRLVLTLETDLPDEGAVNVPEVRPLDVARDQGFVVVRAPATVKVLPQAENLFRTDFSGVPASARTADLVVAYRFPAHPWTLGLSIRRIEPVVDVDGRTRIFLDGRRLHLSDRFTYSVSRVPVFSREIALPPDLTVTDVDSGVVDDWRIEGEGDDRVLVLELGKSSIGNFVVSVASTRPFVVEDDPAELSLPLLRPLAVRRIQGLVGVACEESLKLETGETAGLVPVEESAFGEGAKIAFRYRQSDRSAVVTVSRRDPEVTARVATELHAEENRIAVTSRITWTVKYAGVEEFAFTLPAELRDRMHVTGNNIREKPVSDIEPAENEEARILCRVVLQGKVTGDYAVTVEYDLPYEDLEVGETAEVSVPALIVSDVKREEGVYAVYRDTALEVREVIDGLEPIDVRELPAGVDRQEVFLAFKYFVHPHSLSLGVEKHEPLGVLVAAVLHQHVVTVLNDEGVARTEVVLVMKNNGLQFLSLSLASAQSGKRVRPDSLDLFVARGGRLQRNGEIPQEGPGGEILVRMPPEVGAEDVFYVKLVFPIREEVPGLIFHRFVYEAPLVQGGAVPVTGTTWHVYPPVDVTVTRTGGTLKLLSQSDSWVSAIVAATPAVFRRSRIARAAFDADRSNLPGGVAELAPSGQAPLVFGGRSLSPTVEITYADPGAFGAVLVVVFLSVVAAGILVLRTGNRSVRVGFFGIAIGLTLLLIPVSSDGVAVALTVAFFGAILSGVVWSAMGALGIAAGLRRRWKFSRDARPTPEEESGMDEAVEAEDARPENGKSDDRESDDGESDDGESDDGAGADERTPNGKEG